MVRESKDDAINRIMAGLKCTRQEAEQVYEYDKAIDHDERTEYDLSPEKLKIERQMARTGTRKKPMVPKLTKRERKPNATKQGIVSELAQFLKIDSQFLTENVQITNKEREILLKICGEWYTITLTYKRNLNKK